MKLQGIMLQSELLRQLNDENLTYEEKSLLRCRLAKELEDTGNYEAAAGALGDLWKGVAIRPRIENLSDRAAAEILLRAGTLSGWIGSSKRITGAQEKAKDLISESRAIFEKSGELERAAEAQVELAYCYWREGAFDEARVTIDETLKALADNDSEIKAIALIRKAIIEMSAFRLNDAERILMESATFIETFDNHLIRANLHSNLGIVLKDLGGDERRDRAFVEFAAASFHFKQAGHTRYRAYTENNLGYLYLLVGKYSEAHEHLDNAKRLFATLDDSGSVAQVDETRARVFLAEENYEAAEKAARSAATQLESSDEKALLAQALTTQCTALARLGKYELARTVIERAKTIADQAGDREGAGLAHLTAIEELTVHLHADELINSYLMADYLLSESQHPDKFPRLISSARLIFSTTRLRPGTGDNASFINASEQTRRLLKTASIIARANSATLVSGETGTGKEVLSRLIHEWSGRKGQFVAINCAAIPEELIESELFGYRKGAFTGAADDYSGAVAQAIGGTLFLDEIGELSMSAQAKILRLIESGEIHPVGAELPLQVDARIVAATNRDLRRMVKEGKFRDDLYYRLETFQLHIPALRERLDDIPALAQHFLTEACSRHGKRVTFSPESIEAMRILPLKGNARELRTLIERSVILSADGRAIRKEDVEALAARNTDEGNLADAWAGCSFKREVLGFEAGLIRQALKEVKGSVTRAAHLLGLTHQSLREMLENRHIDLLNERKPATKRKRSIMNKEKTAKIRKMKRRGR